MNVLGDLFNAFRRLFYVTPQEQAAAIQTGEKLNDINQQRKEQQKWSDYQKAMEDKYKIPVEPVDMNINLEGMANSSIAGMALLMGVILLFLKIIGR